MSAEWKPGDVAMSTQGRVMRCSFAYGKKSGWVYDDGSGSPGNDPGVVRPLAVIDPEDREAAKRLLADFCQAVDASDVPAHPQGWSVNAMQAALREFAAPKPPRPEEPTGLGAVVEDEDGQRFVRVGPTIGNFHWRSTEPANTDCFPWRTVKAVRILSPGVEVDQ